MAYPEKGAKYAGQDRASKIAGRAEGGSVASKPKPDIEPLKVDPEGPLGRSLLRTNPQGRYQGKIKFER